MKAPEGLIALLDDLEEMLRTKLVTMRELRRCMREADLQGLSEVLARQAGLSAEGNMLEQRIREVRRYLSRPSLLTPDGITLSRLVEMLDGPDAIAVNDRRERISLAVRELQAESIQTARLAHAVADLNHQMLAAVVGCSAEQETYSASGMRAPRFRATTFEQTV